MPGLLPIGRWVGDPKARAEVALAWNKATLPSTPGRSTSALLDAAAAAASWARSSSPGVDPADLPDPAAALRALDQTPFIVSLELRASAVTDRADVVFPVAAVAEKAGTFVNWEGRGGTFAPALSVPGVRTDLYVLGAIADEMDVHLGLPTRPPRARSSPPSAPGRAPARPRPRCSPRGTVQPAAAPTRPSGHLAPAHRRGADAGRRAVPGGHRPAGGGAGLPGHRGRRRALPTATR